ncbi:hypothetical protein FACS189427_00810 [Planctomycetales bacterium]|nr:hypothetical protein FACS189427_00810 [Planctomycetales bacterium]
MFFEILVEDASGKLLLEHLVPKIIGMKDKPHRYRIINIQELKHRTMSRMPRHLVKTMPWDTILFQTLSMQLRAYGKSLPKKNGILLILIDLDYRNRETFREQINGLFHQCNPAPEGAVCFCIEEIEAWLLGDLAAVRHSYPLAKEYVLTSYVQDSICGTWEQLADALYHGGSEALREIGYPYIGREKSRWADNIGQYMDVHNNRSPSFCEFRDLLLQWVNSK